jgi:hypothetical protein
MELPNFLKTSTQKGVDRIREAEKKVAKAAADLETAGMKLDDCADFPESDQAARKKFEAARSEFSRCREEHERLARVLEITKGQEAKAAEVAEKERRKKRVKEVVSLFDGPLKSTNRIEELLAELAHEFRVAKEAVVEISGKYYVLAQDLGLEQLDATFGGLNRLRLESEFLLCLTKCGLPGGNPWPHGNPERIPPVGTGVRNSKDFILSRTKAIRGE